MAQTQLGRLTYGINLKASALGFTAGVDIAAEICISKVWERKVYQKAEVRGEIMNRGEIMSELGSSIILVGLRLG